MFIDKKLHFEANLNRNEFSGAQIKNKTMKEELRKPTSRRKISEDYLYKGHEKLNL